MHCGFFRKSFVALCLLVWTGLACAQGTPTVTFLVQPAATSGLPGGTASFSFKVRVTGSSQALTVFSYLKGSLHNERFTVAAQTVANVTVSGVNYTDGDFTMQISDLTAFDSGGTCQFEIVVNGQHYANATSAAAALTVGQPRAPAIDTHPYDQIVIAGGAASFAVDASGTPAPAFQWQVSTNGGGTWASVANASPYSGATGATLTVSPATVSLSGNRYRCVATNTVSSATSDFATLTVNPAPQTVAFGALANRTYGVAPFALSATSSAGLAVSFTVISGPATLSGATLTLTGTGVVTVRASQPGNADFTAAPSVDQAFTVAKAALTVTAADQTRAVGEANPALTFTYAGFVNNETAAVLTSLPTASTTATLASAVGSYPITLTGGAAANYTITLVNATLTVTPRGFRGAYFGTAGSGGPWAIYVRPDGSAIFIAYLSSRHSAIVTALTVGNTGAFAVSGSEIRAAGAGSANTRAGADLSPEGPALRAPAAAGDFTLTGQISGGSVTASLAGLGETLTGAADATTGPALALVGYYTATALATANGAFYAIVGASGQTVAVTAGPALIDGAAGTVNASGQLTATTSGGGALALTVTAQSLSATLTPAGAGTPVGFAGLPETIAPAARVVNLSVRTTAGTGDQTLIVGLVIVGSGNKTLLLRGIGPTLSTQGVANPLADPTMRLLNLAGAEVAANNDWGGTAQMSANFASVGAFALPANSKDAALFNVLPTGLYSFHTFPNGAGTGIVLAEVYDADDNTSAASVFNISARTQVGTGENILIAGFVITGNSPKTLLIRGLGPTLAAQGVAGALVNPQLFLFGSGGLVGSNDDWGGTAALKNAFAATGAGSLTADTSKDAALLVTLMPGVYSAQVSGVGTTTGVGLVEIFLMP